MHQAISNKTFEEWNRETGGAKLPERVAAPAAKKKTSKKKAGRKTKATPGRKAATRKRKA